jgi:uncharacterized integral membrane protein
LLESQVILCKKINIKNKRKRRILTRKLLAQTCGKLVFYVKIKEKKMKLKSIWKIIYTGIIIIVVFSLTITFLQKQFIEQTATLKFLFWETPDYPIICFVTAAFLIGLFTGLIIAVIDSFQKQKIIRRLMKDLDVKETKKEPESDKKS